MMTPSMTTMMTWAIMPRIVMTLYLLKVLPMGAVSSSRSSAASSVTAFSSSAMTFFLSLLARASPSC